MHLNAHYNLLATYHQEQLLLLSSFVNEHTKGPQTVCAPQSRRHSTALYSVQCAVCALCALGPNGSW